MQTTAANATQEVLPLPKLKPAGETTKSVISPAGNVW